MNLYSKLRSYSLLGILRLIRDITLTFLIFRKARLIRYPFYVRGWRYINWGKNLTFGINMRVDAFKFLEEDPKIIFGKNCQFNDYVHIACCSRVEIGDDVLVASKVFISDHNHGSFHLNPEMHLPPRERSIEASPVFIKSNVWIGENVNILPGVEIGEYSVIGAGATVTKKIPSYSLAVGSPAKVIKKYNKKSQEWEPS
jgi:lipopolysaccharide O-acetyltransferase